MTRLLAEGCRPFLERLASIVRRESEGCDCALLSGGVDTSFVVLHSPERRSLTVFTVDLGGSDQWYAGLAARRLGVGLHVLLRPGAEEFRRALAWAVGEIGTIDPVEASADATHYLALSAAARWGCRCVLSGDGGDELFLGYTFLLAMPPGELGEWRRLMASGGAWMPTLEVGRRLGVEVRAPLYSPEARSLSLETPLRCLASRGLGKELLRASLEEAGLREVALRPKTPVTSGSGALLALKRLAGENPSTPPGEAARRLAMPRPPPTRLHAWLASLLLESGRQPPPPGGPDPCPVCGRPLRRGYCRFCGAVVRGGRVSLHSGE